MSDNLTEAGILVAGLLGHAHGAANRCSKLMELLDEMKRAGNGYEDQQPLDQAAWDALNKAERRLHRDNPGCNGWTDVMYREDDVFPAILWRYAQNPVEEELSEAGDKHVTDAHLNGQIARRVALAINILAFGPEIALAI